MIHVAKPFEQRRGAKSAENSFLCTAIDQGLRMVHLFAIRITCIKSGRAGGNRHAPALVLLISTGHKYTGSDIRALAPTGEPVEALLA